MAVSAPLCNVPSFLSPWSPQLPKPSHPSLSFPHHLSSNSNSLLALSCAHSPTKTDALIPSPPAMDSLLPSPSTTTLTPTSSSTIGAGFGFDWSSPLGCPSLAYANVLFFKSTYNVRVIVEENEPEGRLLNRFKREVARAGILQECRRRRFFENKHDKKKRKAREAAKRNRKRRPMLKDNKKESSKSKTRDDDEDDNWELPEGSLPY